MKGITQQKAAMRHGPAIGPYIAKGIGWKKVLRRRPFQARSFASRSPGVASSYRDLGELTRDNYEGGGHGYCEECAKTAHRGPDSRCKGERPSKL